MAAVTQESVVEDITSLLSVSDADERIRYGKTKAGTPRWKCKGCGSVRCHIDTGSILANTKLDEGKWMDYAMCFVDGLTCDEVARRIGVCHKTAWFMRLRTIQAISSSMSVAEGL